MQATVFLCAVIWCGFSAAVAAENVGTTNDGGLKTGPKPKPKPTPAEKVLDPIHNANSGAFGTKPNTPATPKPPTVVLPAPRSVILNSGKATLPSMSNFDFDTGNVSPGGDLFYNQRVDGRFLRARNGAMLALLQKADFGKTGDDRLRSASYAADTTINASDTADNELRRGVLIVIKTKGGHFAKIRVISLGRELSFEWVTYR